MAETVMVLPPDMRTKQIVETGDGATPRNVTAHLEPLGMLIEHRVDDVDEGLIAREEAMTACEQISFQPTLTLVFRKNFHHPTIRREMIVVWIHFGDVATVCHVEDILPAVGIILIRA